MTEWAMFHHQDRPNGLLEWQEGFGTEGVEKTGLPLSKPRMAVLSQGLDWLLMTNAAGIDWNERIRRADLDTNLSMPATVLSAAFNF